MVKPEVLESDNSTALLSLESSLFEAIDEGDQDRVLELLDRMIKASVEHSMLQEWLVNIVESKGIFLGKDLKSWIKLRFEYHEEMRD